MTAPQTLKVLRESLGISQTDLAKQIGVKQPSIAVIENMADRIPRTETVQQLLAAYNHVLAARGSNRRLTYDELWASICVGRLGVLPVAPPDTTGDLPTVDQSTTAPAPLAQGV